MRSESRLRRAVERAVAGVSALSKLALEFAFVLAAALALALVVPPAAAIAAETPSPVIRIPGASDSTLTDGRLRAAGTIPVPATSEHGESVTYKAVALLDILESSGLDTRNMASERKTASAVVVATARDGYAVVFSVGELTMHRSDPRVFVTAETSSGPLPAEQGPVRLVVPSQRAVEDRAPVSRRQQALAKPVDSGREPRGMGALDGFARGGGIPDGRVPG